MIDLDYYFSRAPYSVGADEKQARLLADLTQLTEHHRESCSSYERIVRSAGASRPGGAWGSIPRLAVRLFKELELRSVPDEAVFTVLTSSGTTGQSVSRIALDRATSGLQRKALVKIVSDLIGSARLPMLIIDHPGVIKDRRTFSARGAGILGMSNFGRFHTYALREDMSLDLEAVRGFASEYAGRPKLVFGFTFMVWEYFHRALEHAGLSIDLSDSTLVHSGGWKKLVERSVDNETFKAGLSRTAGIDRVHNFYGMVEQVGSIFMECEHGALHAPLFADVVARRPLDWSVCAPGEVGLLQVLSVLPYSYPGHSLLTEDRGEVLGRDDCPCGRLGTYFKVHGRLPQAEVRGCSDTHATEAGR